MVDDKAYDFHLLPSGVVGDNCKSLIGMILRFTNSFHSHDENYTLGNGTVIHLSDLFKEIENNEEKGLQGIRDNLFISDRAHIGDYQW